MLPQASAQFRSENELTAFPELNVVRFARYDELGAFREGIADIDALRMRNMSTL
jgi:hypothetical protein